MTIQVIIWGSWYLTGFRSTLSVYEIQLTDTWFISLPFAINPWLSILIWPIACLLIPFFYRKGGILEEILSWWQLGAMLGVSVLLGIFLELNSSPFAPFSLSITGIAGLFILIVALMIVGLAILEKCPLSRALVHSGATISILFAGYTFGYLSSALVGKIVLSLLPGVICGVLNQALLLNKKEGETKKKKEIQATAIILLSILLLTPLFSILYSVVLDSLLTTLVITCILGECAFFIVLFISPALTPDKKTLPLLPLKIYNWLIAAKDTNS